jgi:hypothetical protein
MTSHKCPCCDKEIEFPANVIPTTEDLILSCTWCNEPKACAAIIRIREEMARRA